jgi:hypothetical protein
MYNYVYKPDKKDDKGQTRNLLREDARSQTENRVKCIKKNVFRDPIRDS